jgi:hypothetical protein
MAKVIENPELLKKQLADIGWSPDTNNDNDLWALLENEDITPKEWEIAYRNFIMTNSEYERLHNEKYHQVYMDMINGRYRPPGSSNAGACLFGAGLKGGRGKGKEKEKVRKGSYKGRSKSEEGSGSSSSSSLSKQARIGACSRLGGYLADMDVFEDIRKKKKVGSKKKSPKKNDSDSDSDSDSDDEKPIRMARYGKVRKVEDVLDEELDEEDVQILESLGEHFDLLYNRLQSSEKAEIKERIKNAA